MKKMLQRCRAAIAVGVVAVLAGAGILQAATVDLTVYQSVKEGLSIASSRTSSGLVASSNTYQFSNDGKVFLLFEKTGAGASTITVTTPGTIQGIAISDLTASVAATTGDVIVGPFPPSLFNDSSGKVQFTISDTVGLSLIALRL